MWLTPSHPVVRRTDAVARKPACGDSTWRAEILQGKPFRDLTVDELMSATGLSRTAFYRYFPDREAVLLELLEEVWGELADARDAEAVGADFDDATSMARLTELLAANQAVLKAITERLSVTRTSIPPTSLMHSYWIEDLTARIVEAQSHGLAAGLDPDLAGEALGWMVERMVTQSVTRTPAWSYRCCNDRA